jgi:hypothetical protein
MPLPELSYEDMRPTREALHRLLQVVGKIRQAAEPSLGTPTRAVLIPTARGVTTGLLPGGVEIRVDLLQHVVRVVRASGAVRTFSLEERTVAGFYHTLLETLEELGSSVSIDPAPYPGPEGDETPLSEDEARGGSGFDPGHARRMFRVWAAVYPLLSDLRSRFDGATREVGLEWDRLNVAVRLFSGRSAEPPESAIGGARDELSRELFTAGFSFGTRHTPEAHFYAWIYPAPELAAEEASAGELRPSGAIWDQPDTSAYLVYRAVAPRVDWHDALGWFFDSAYRAESTAREWEVPMLTNPRA